MGKSYFTNEKIKDLKDNPNIEKVTKKAIKYSEEFKIESWNRYNNDELSSSILSSSDIDPHIQGHRRMSNIVQRIKKESQRLEGFNDTRKQNTGRPKTKDMTPEEKYKNIEEMTSRDNNLLNITYLCSIAEVSRSGYYSWIKNKEKCQKKHEDDKADFKLILRAYKHRGYDKGAKSIHMQLLHMGIRMNIKKIRRLMKKFGLICKIRRSNPYRRMAKAIKTNHIAPNIINAFNNICNTCHNCYRSY